MSDDPIEVSQAARDAAVDIHNVMLHDWFTQHIQDGMEDECYVVQAFAKFEQAIRADQIEKCEREGQSIWRCAIGDFVGALDALKNAWASSKRRQDRDAGEQIDKVLSLVWAARSPAPKSYDQAAESGKRLIQLVRDNLPAIRNQKGEK